MDGRARRGRGARTPTSRRRSRPISRRRRSAAAALGSDPRALPGPQDALNAWWGSFDLAVSLFSDQQETAIGWWPGTTATRRPPSTPMCGRPDRIRGGTSSPPARWDEALGEFLLDWDDVVAVEDPQRVARDFLVGATRHAEASSHG